MTEYGRGPGSEPWHPEDPLFGDEGWGGQQAQAAASPYGGQPQHYSQPQQQHYGDWGHGQQAGYDQGQQQYPQQQPQYTGQEQPQYPDQNGQGYPGQQYPGQPDQNYPGQGGQSYAGHMPQQQYGNGGWDGGTQTQIPYAADPSDPYGAQSAAYNGEQPDFYQTPDAYPPPEPPNRRRTEPEPEPEANPETGWDPGPDQGEHAFFADGADGDDETDDDGRGRRGGKGKGKSKGAKKRRNGCACLVVVLVFGGGLGGVGYFGWQFYQNRFGPVPDYAGDGTGTKVTITIKKGSGGYAIGQALKEAGVVKSVDAFVAAQSKNPKGNTIQAGTYTLKKEMSGASAVTLMLSPASRNNLVIYEGERNATVYAAIDKRLGLDSGTTKGVAKKKYASLGLPSWANSSKEIKDPLEGFLFPSAYPVAKGMKPEAVLKEMVSQAATKYEEYGIATKYKSLGLSSPLQLLTVASLVNAEGNNKSDYEKVARVVYNRLKPDNTETYGLLDFDSTVNYLKGESKLNTGSVSSLRQIDDPYNTYKIKGLPPGPIDNPGDVAIKAAISPATGNWYYFVSVSKDKTLFAETNEEQNANRQQYLEEQEAQNN